MRKASLIASIIIFALLICPLAPLNSVNFASNINKVEALSTESPQRINILEYEMTVPFEMKVLLEDRYAHDYYDYDEYNYFFGDLETIYGLTINSTKRDGITFTFENISQYDFLIIPNPELGNLTVAEQQAIIRYLNETRGATFIMGHSNYSAKLNIHTLNNITKPFGIEYLWGQVKDKTDYDYRTYYPLAHNWTNTEIASTLGDNYKVKMMGGTTSLNISNPAINGTWLYIYKLATGDDDTEFTPEWNESKVIYFAWIDVIGYGTALVSGSTGFLADYYGYLTNDNRDFALNVVEYMMSRDLALTRFEHPTGTVLAGQTIYVNLTVKNRADHNITNIHVGLEFSGALELLNDSNILDIAVLEPNQEINVTFELKVVGTSNVVMEAKAWSDEANVFGYQKRAEFTTLGLMVDAKVSPDYIVIENFDTVKLTVNVTNPRENPNATNVNVSIILPADVQTENDTFYHFGIIENGTSKIIEIYLTSNVAGLKTVNIELVSENLGTASAKVTFGVYAKPFIVFDQGHYQYFTAEVLSKFVALLKNYGDVYLNNGTLDRNLLGNTSLVILPIPGVETYGSGDPSSWTVPKPLTGEEIDALIDYINNGGKLIAIATWYRYILDGTLHGLNNVTSSFGIYFQDAEIVDDEDNAGKPYYPILRNLEKHPIASDVEFIIAASSTYILITGNAKAVVRGNPTSYGVTNESNTYDYHPTGVNGSDLIAVAAVETQNNGKIVAFGGGSMLGDYYFDNNSMLIENTIKWILGDTEAPTVTISTENITDAEGNVIGVNITIIAEDNLALRSIVVTVNESEKYRNDELLTHSFVYTFTVEGAGTYIISVSVEDHAGLVTSKEITVTIPKIEEAPTPTWIYIVIGVIIIVIIIAAVYMLKKKQV